MRFKLLLGLLSFVVFTLEAQEDFIHYTSDQGLPSSEVYDVLCDQKGFVWISTDRGVSRFNGYTFENFYTSDGLTDNVIIEMFEDRQDRIWFSANSGRLCYYNYADARIHAYAYNDSLKKYMPGLVVIKSIRLDSTGTLFVGYLHYGALSVSGQGKVTLLEGIPKRRGEKSSTVHFGEIEGQPFLYSYGAIGGRRMARVMIDLPGMKQELNLTVEAGRFTDEYMLKRRNGTYLLSVPGSLLELCPGKKPVIVPLKDDVRRIFEDSGGRLWLCLRHEGLRLYAAGETIASAHYASLLGGKYTNAICEDKERGMWTGVYNNGLYYKPMRNIRVEKVEGIPSTLAIRSIGAKDSDLYVGTESNRLYCLHPNGTLDNQVLPASNVLVIQALDGGLMLYGKNRCYIRGKRRLVLGDSVSFMSAYCLYASDSIVYVGSHSGIYRFRRQAPYTELPFLRTFPSRIEAIFNDKGRLLLGNSNGVHALVGDSVVSCNHWFDKPCRTTSIKAIGDYLAFSTLGEGIRFIHRSNGKRFTLSTHQGLLNNNINALCENGESLWAASSFGLNEIRFGSDSFRVYSYTLSNGLKASEVRQLLVHNQRLWMNTTKGLYSLALSGLVNNPVSIPVHLLSVTSNDTVYTGASLLGNPELHYNSILRIRYVGLSYKQQKNVLYRYRLLGQDEDWTHTRNTEVEFAFLSEGDYTFELCASNEDGEWSPPVAFVFFIKPPFWKTWWFIIGSVLIVLALTFVVFMSRIRRLRKENRIREQLYDYRQQALVARMNPHFIFNSLNAIHYFIFNEDKRVAGKYLSRFASLMRLILDQSTREYVSLEEDIRALSLYMELEAWRFRNKFRFTIDIDASIDAHALQVPPMLVQPFVENAIKHGLLNRTTEGGQLDVRYRFSGRNLECTVEDNGVGRAEAGRLKQGTAHELHRSAGTIITLQRLETASEKNGQPFLLQYTDKTPESHNEPGTLVRFYIPYTYDKNTDH